VLSWNLFGETEENHEASESIFEHWTSQIETRILSTQPRRLVTSTASRNRHLLTEISELFLQNRVVTILRRMYRVHVQLAAVGLTLSKQVYEWFMWKQCPTIGSRIVGHALRGCFWASGGRVVCVRDIRILNEIGCKIQYIFLKALCLIEIWCLLYSITCISLKFEACPESKFRSRIPAAQVVWAGCACAVMSQEPRRLHQTQCQFSYFVYKFILTWNEHENRKSRQLWDTVSDHIF
jgi:hypothetical protein